MMGEFLSGISIGNPSGRGSFADRTGRLHPPERGRPLTAIQPFDARRWNNMRCNSREKEAV